MENIFERLFIFEMANNHMGDVEHGLKLINKLGAIARKFPFRFAFKFQYRDLDSFIHPDYKKRMDVKYVKRFTETRLTENEFKAMKKCAADNGFLTMCTPFDEISVGRIESHGYNILKIASCSLTDWPLLERIVDTDLPIIASTAGAELEDIDNVVSFFTHRGKKLCIMHCVGAYPTSDDALELNQIRLFQNRYPEVPIGYSTHERPDNYEAVKMAVAMGSNAFERHVGLSNDKYSLNAYSSSPKHIGNWLSAAESAYESCGTLGERREISNKEYEDLNGLKRGVFALEPLTSGTVVSLDNTFLAIPNAMGQLLANDLSKYSRFTLAKDVTSTSPVLRENLKSENMRLRILEIIKDLSDLLKESGIKLKNQLELELSHHYGIDLFDSYGCSMINCINREYCKKIIMLLPEQENPTHFHKKKEETFHVLHGDMELTMDGTTHTYEAGDLIVVERGVKHSFSSRQGAIFEEVSTTHFKNDSFYEDESIMSNPDRKTQMTFWTDWLMGEIK